MSNSHQNQHFPIKHLLKRTLLCGILVSGPCIPTYAEPIVPDTVTNQEIINPLNTATLDDYLLDMARAAKVNVLADATNFPVGSSIKSYPATSGAIAGKKGKNPDKWGPRFINVMGDLAAQEHLSVLRPDARTFLFWSEPELHSLYELQRAVTADAETQLFAESVAAARIEGIPDQKIISGEISETQLESVLRAYLKKQHNWTGAVNERTDNIDLRTRFEDLQPSLRALILSDIRYRCVRSLKESWWKEDELRLRAKEDGTTTILVLEYRNVNKDEKPENWIGFPFTRLEKAQPTHETEATLQLQELSPTIAQVGPTDTLVNAYSDLDEKAMVPLLNDDGALQRPITLQVKRLALGDLLKQLEEQSGIRFKVSEDAPSSNLATIGVEKMPLSRLMGLLGRVYGVTWTKEPDTTYEMHGNKRGQLHMQLLQMGDPSRYRFRFAFYNRLDRANEEVAVGRAIVQQAGLESLQAEDGVAFSTLPQPLQERLRHVIQDPGLETGARMLYSMNRTLVEQLTQKQLFLRFGISPREDLHSPFLGFGGGDTLPLPLPLPLPLRFTIQSDDGHMNVPVFDSFTTPVALLGEGKPIRQPSRRR